MKVGERHLLKGVHPSICFSSGSYEKPLQLLIEWPVSGGILGSSRRTYVQS